MEEGVMQELLTDYKDWIYEKFDDIRKWSEAEGDDERVVWLRCHGVPAHAWNNEFFERLASKFGVLLGTDEDTRKKTSMEVARLRIRTKSYDVFNMVVEAYINNSRCDIKVVEEWCGPLYWISQQNANEKDEESLASDEDSDADDDGPPLLMAEDGGYESPLEREEEEKSPDIKKHPIITENHDAQPFTQGSNDSIENGERRSIMNNYDNQKEGGNVRGEHGNGSSQNFIGGEENVGVKDVGSQHIMEVETSQIGENIVSGGTHKENDVVESVPGCNSKSGGCEKQVIRKIKRKAHLYKGKKVKKKDKGDGMKRKEGVDKAQRVSLGKNPTLTQKQNGETSLTSLQGRKQGSGVVRNQIEASLSISSTNAKEASQLHDYSAGDSGIAAGNCRFIIDHDKSTVEKIWGLATEKLGVTGRADDGVYKEKIREKERS